ncbi:MAG TPA: protein-disulfide reductase DsbD domain-containing protein [Hyphomicrobiaceae bacterium]|nr:protein-disulfide reductase DsbD domain-containing protein [Hyphomicrobiaceae bacterium]
MPHHQSHRAAIAWSRQGAYAAALFSFLLVIAGWGVTTRAGEPGQDLVRAELVAEPPAVTAGTPFWVGVRLHIKDHWHVYWRNPGDSGEAPTITWTLPPGFSAGPIVWPTPHRIPVAHLANFGYEGEATLLTRITPPASLAAGTPVDLKAQVTWLVCEKECVPGEASLTVGLPAALSDAAPRPDANKSAYFEAARAALPQPSPWDARMSLAPDRVTLHVDLKGASPDAIRSAFYFPNEGALIQHAAPQQLRKDRDGLSLDLERSALSTAAPANGGGVLVIDEDLGSRTARQAFELAHVRVGAANPAPTATTLALVVQAALLALAGGIILNLMPCVFPVLSIKVLALAEQAGGSRSRVRRHGVAYTAGVLAAFAVLAAVLLAVRAGGAEVGWGFQLQSPVVVALLAYLLFAMALSLSGVFHIGASMQGLGTGLMRRSGLAGSFFTGVLAAVVATPCTAPLMGTAVGFALTQPAPVALTVILALGLGLALPFLALSLAPPLIGLLPRPGAWMETLRQMLAFPVYATAAWLAWVLAQQVSPAGLFAALIGFVLIALAAWSFNAAQSAGGWGRRAGAAVALASLAGVAVAVAGLGQDRLQGAAASQSAAGYEPFTQARLDELLAGRRPVFVNMTAAWCITCLVNERTTLSSEPVRAGFAAKGVAYLKGDWTNRNAEITRLLEKHGRSGVPLYLLYAGDGEPTVFPQVLTQAAVLSEIDRLPSPAERRASLPTSAKE